MYQKVSHKRESDRIPIVLPATWHRPDGEVTMVQTGNISDGGILLQAPCFIPPDQRIKLEIRLPGEGAPVQATVQARFVGPADGGFTIGAKIYEMPEADRERWQAFCRKLIARTLQPESAEEEGRCQRSSAQILLLSSALGPRMLTALTESGCFVSVAGGAPEALSLLHQRRDFEILICEVRRNDLDGRTLCDLIRQERALQDVHVILLAGEDSPRDLAEGLAAGATYVVARPFTEEFLLSLISLCQRA
jgi:CheY-like chemotaxis protein